MHETYLRRSLGPGGTLAANRMCMVWFVVSRVTLGACSPSPTREKPRARSPSPTHEKPGALPFRQDTHTGSEFESVFAY